MSTPTAVLITAVLSLFLVAYVFLGSRHRTDRAPHCTSREVLEQVKLELFRRAASERSPADPAFANIGRYSVIRTASRMLRRRASDNVGCTGSIALDLPPGVTAPGGRANIESSVAYQLEPAGAGKARLVSLSRAEALVAQLAALSQADNETGQAVTNELRPNGPTAPPPVTIEPQPARPAARGSPSRPRVEPPKAPPPAPKKAVAAATRTPPDASGTPAVKAPTPTTISVARPSFNCRYARTRGEIAVCSDAALANLDRRMAAQFYSALSVARPGQRAMLQRTRTRFLRFRDACPTRACIAEAYLGRMREISNIVAGQW